MRTDPGKPALPVCRSGEATVSDRDAEIADFLARAGWADAERSLLAKDASYRVYHRIARGAERTVLMDAPPALEDVRPFVDVADQLRRFGYSVPRVLAADVPAGLLLLEDFGDRTFTRILSDADDEWTEEALYRLAVDLLVDLHARAPEIGFSVPDYHQARLLEEADRMLRWYAPLVLEGLLPSDAVEAYAAAWSEAIPFMVAETPTLVLRDFHVDNLMVLEGRDGLSRCGLLDFQDALAGHPAYDLVSLLQDSRRDLAPGLEQAMLERYRAQARVGDWEGFLNSYHALGAQRSLKILGQFGRQLGFFGREGYLVHVPRIWAHVERDLARSGLDSVVAWLDRWMPPAVRTVPPATARLPDSVSPEIKR